jgi:molybdopterin molybdotransferase
MTSAMTDALKSVDAHLADVMAVVRPLSGLDLTLSDAHGCVLVEDVHTTFPLPPFDNSAMDGYAVRSEDLRAASAGSPVVLPVVGDVAAGSASPYTVQPGLCVRIMTGAAMPPGADAVVPLERTDGGIAQVAIGQPVEPGSCIRRAGEDAQPGAEVLAAGTHLGATQLGLLAAVGRDRVQVRPRPRVVVLSTGSELVEPGQQLSRGQIPDSNSALLTAAALEAGAIAYRVGIVPDEPGVLADTLEDQLIRADMIVTTGGVSVGAYDVVKEVLSRVGTVQFERVAMQPGMPQGFGTIGPDQTPFFGLPGNPVSAYVSFEVFVRPALRRMLGVEPTSRPVVRAPVTQPLRSPAGKQSYLRAWLAVEDGAYVVRPVGGPGSHLISALAASNALIVLAEDTTEVAAGTPVNVLLLERRQQ